MKPHILWTDRKTLSLLDQRLLPNEVVFREYAQPAEIGAAITGMVVRGAPAIGVTAAYAMAIAAWIGAEKECSTRDFKRMLTSDAEQLRKARPTAVNLAWAVDRLLCLAKDLIKNGAEPEDVALALEEEAVQIHADDIAMCKAIGRHGQAYAKKGAAILTHCNAGALATGGYGTALGVVRAAHEAGKSIRVFADETRPFLQGTRLTAWELQQDGIPVTLLCDNMAGFLMARGEVDLVVVGADRIAANGDTANKIGTYPLAVLAHRHGVPFVVAAPSSTFDPDTKTGEGIPIEYRPEEEVLSVGGARLAPGGVPALNPAFDVTPHDLITAIITEDGAVSPVDDETVGQFLAKGRP